MVNMEHKKVMLDLQKFPMEMREALYKCKELTEDQLLPGLWFYFVYLIPVSTRLILLSARSLRAPPNIVLSTSTAAR